MVDHEAENEALAAIVARGWGDADFHAELMADPTAVLKANGVHVPDGKRVVVVEDDDTVLHITIPQRPSELTDEELDSVAGGYLSFPCATKDGPIW